MNKFIILGRLSTDIESRTTAEGKMVSRFNFAVNRRFKREGEPDADFFTCVAFGKIAETFQKCDVGKGTKLLLEAEVRNNNYEKDGVKHYGTQVIVNSFEFCESKSSGDSEYVPQTVSAQNAIAQESDIDGFVPIEDMDLPF